VGLLDLRWGILAGYGPLFVAGVWMTLQLTTVALAGGLVLGVVLGLVSCSADAPKPPSMLAALAWSVLRGATRGYVGFFRGTPLFVQILLVHFALMPMLIHPDGGLLLGGEAAREFRQSHGALVSAIGLAELALAARTVASAYSRYWGPYGDLPGHHAGAVGVGQAPRSAGAPAWPLTTPRRARIRPTHRVLETSSAHPIIRLLALGTNEC